MELTATKERLFRLQKDNVVLENRSRVAAEEHKEEKESFLRSFDELHKQKLDLEAEANEWLQENIRLGTDNRNAKLAKQKAEKESEYRQALLQRTKAIFDAFAAASDQVFSEVLLSRGESEGENAVFHPFRNSKQTFWSKRHHGLTYGVARSDHGLRTEAALSRCLGMLAWLKWRT
jgi:hypothetical protein